MPRGGVRERGDGRPFGPRPAVKRDALRGRIRRAVPATRPDQNEPNRRGGPMTEGNPSGCALPLYEDGMVDYSANGSTHRCSPTGKRPDLRALCGLRHASDTLKKSKRITKPQTKPELGI